jgi:hypothetical protein
MIADARRRARQSAANPKTGQGISHGQGSG